MPVFCVVVYVIHVVYLYEYSFVHMYQDFHGYVDIQEQHISSWPCGSNVCSFVFNLRLFVCICIVSVYDICVSFYDSLYGHIGAAYYVFSYVFCMCTKAWPFFSFSDSIMFMDI